MIALALLAMATGEIVIPEPECGWVEPKRRSQCVFALRNIEEVQKTVTVCAQQSARAFDHNTQADVTSGAFARKLGKIARQCSNERSLCIAVQLQNSKFFKLSDRMKVVRATSDCEAAFWNVIIPKSGATGQSYKDIGNSNAPNQ